LAFDIPNLHIEQDSPEGQNLQAIILRDQVSPEEAIRSALRQVPATSPADQMWGAFAGAEDSSVLDEAMKHVKELRETEQLRDFGH
jgi:hypothetical protein